MHNKRMHGSSHKPLTNAVDDVLLQVLRDALFPLTLGEIKDRVPGKHLKTIMDALDGLKKKEKIVKEGAVWRVKE